MISNKSNKKHKTKSSTTKITKKSSCSVTVLLRISISGSGGKGPFLSILLKIKRLVSLLMMFKIRYDSKHK